MNVQVKDNCIACQVCIDICPELFEMGDEIAVALVEKVPTSLEDKAEEAAYDCPVDAILLTDVE